MAQRRTMGSRDMIMTMVVVLAVVALIALYGNNTSFAPGAVAQQGPLPTADVVAGFGHAKATMGFPVTVPEDIPADWHPNSTSVSDPDGANDGLAQVGTLKAVRGGWVTPQDTFITLVETAGDTAQTLASEFGTSRAVVGTVTAGGALWQITSGVREEVAWVRTVDGPAGMTTLLITGNADEKAFRTLAEAVSAAIG